MITEALLKRLWPRAPKAAIAAVVGADGVFKRHGITSKLRLAHFMAQISHENGGGTIVRESGAYSAKRIMEIFGQGKHSAAVTPIEAKNLAGDGPALFDRVYGLGNRKKARELGNTQPGDGWRYRGGGFIQTTGRKAYQDASDVSGIDLVTNPDLIADYETAIKVAIAEFADPRTLKAADRDDCLAVTRIINGGTNGLADRRVWLGKWQRALDGEPLPANDRPFVGRTTTGISAAATGVGLTQGADSAGASIQTVVDVLQPVADTSQTITAIIAWLKVAGVVLALAGLAYAAYAKWDDSGRPLPWGRE